MQLVCAQWPVYLCLVWGGHLDPVGVHMCGHMASASLRELAWLHAQVPVPTPGQSSLCECLFWPRDLASPFFLF